MVYCHLFWVASAWLLITFSVGDSPVVLSIVLRHQSFLQPLERLRHVFVDFGFKQLHIDWRLSCFNVVVVDLEGIEQPAEAVVVGANFFVDRFSHGLHNLVEHFLLPAGNLQIDFVETSLLILRSGKAYVGEICILPG